MNIRLVGATLLLLSTLSLSPIAEAQTGGVSTTFRVSGQVTNPVIFNLAKLQKFAVSTQNVTFFAAGQVTSGSYTGALLWDVLQSAGIKVDPNVKNDILRFIVVVTGMDMRQSSALVKSIPSSVATKSSLPTQKMDNRLGKTASPRS